LGYSALEPVKARCELRAIYISEEFALVHGLRPDLSFSTDQCVAIEAQ
jgi:hypothetical protein